MRTIQVYNTLTRKKEVFKPIEDGKVGIYVCGVTPYNDPHIGNARPFVTWDTIRRFFAKCGYEVHYIQNFTDVDDKIIRVSHEQGKTWKEVADHNIDVYFQSMDALNVRRADVYPRVSDTIPEIIEMVQGLVDKGYAYVVDGDVFYSVEKFKGYGKLSGRSLDDMMAGARVEVDERKQNPMDFAVWKSAKPGEPFWESPWGNGRPGWHIECSAMSLKYLGRTFDFHGGGSDLIFPHHENEIAQSQAFCGSEDCFAHYWVHNGFITIHEEKMSKSLGNFFTVADILKKYPGEVLRFFILQTHYRSPLDFSDERLKDAQAGLMRLENARRNAEELSAKDGAADTAKALAEAALSAKESFYTAMADDFNTALAVSYLFAVAKDINVYYNEVVNQGTAFDKENFGKAKDAFYDMAEIIGIFEAKAEEKSDEDAEIDALVEERLAARKEKNWARADEIRDLLKARGIVLKDTAEGTRWERA
ncbi:cysteine--tRNA ligase [Schwartzia succinivorans]|jgi:cysteinyl-tRNA synthetase|uniref:Cysteine--tRNA ligase n=1 Tax=Schwartzia succinivorans DSM 10502 TaxID=1123243 RepID=A0A1M4UC71_9FIRM|nr:cysteine--tRNA ligase [Schwartzia succinivorans]SHE54274.1 cysteinyl-tRNA synthetase [Schwartzia succinivorans DSM 10502]